VNEKIHFENRSRGNGKGPFASSTFEQFSVNKWMLTEMHSLSKEVSRRRRPRESS